MREGSGYTVSPYLFLQVSFVPPLIQTLLDCANVLINVCSHGRWLCGIVYTFHLYKKNYNFPLKL